MRECRSSGFTLVEMVVTIVILAVALVGVANLVSLGSSNSADTLLQTRAMALGESYLDEIMGRRFDERSAASGFDPCYGLNPSDSRRCSTSLGPDTGESSRHRYDDVDDYNGLAEGDGGAALQDAEGYEREGYENFHVTVSVRYAGDDAVLGLDTTDAKLITVTVRSRDQQEGWQFSVYRSNY